jgi:excisionase family DNA binding protein
MIPKLELNIPTDLVKEIEAYAKVEGLTINEFLLWALGEKVGELRERRGVRNLIRVIPNPPPERPVKPANSVIDKAQPPSTVQKRLLRAVEVGKYLSINKSNAYRLMQTGELTVVRIGKSVRVREEDLENYVLTNKT